MQLSKPCTQPKKHDIFKQQTRNGIHTASSWLLWKFGQKREAAGECAKVITCAEGEVGEHSPPQQTKHFFLAGCWKRGDRDQPGPTKALTPIWHISVLVHLTIQVWPGAGGSAAAKSLVMLWLPSWRGLDARGGLLTCAFQPSGAAQLCPVLPMAERDGTSQGDIQSRSRHHLIPEAARTAWSHGLLPVWKLDKFNQYRILQHKRGPEGAAGCCVLGQPQHREKLTSTEALATDSGAGKMWQHQDWPGCWLTVDVDAL